MSRKPARFVVDSDQMTPEKQVEYLKWKLGSVIAECTDRRRTNKQLEGDIDQLNEDIARLTEERDFYKARVAGRSGDVPVSTRRVRMNGPLGVDRESRETN